MSGLAMMKSMEAKSITPCDIMETQSSTNLTREDASSFAKNNRESVAWLGDTVSIGTAFKDETKVFGSTGEWAENLFYAYARRSDDARFSRYLLTFSSALVCAEWWSLLQDYFGGAPDNTRESPQFFSFKGDDLPGRAWKHTAFSHLKSKWMFSQIGDAVGTMGKGQEIIPLQDERGFLVQARPRDVQQVPERQSHRDRADSRANSIEEEFNQRDGPFKLRRASKRDSGIFSGISIPTSPFLAQINHERSQSMPSAIAAPAIQPPPPADTSSFDFARMEQNLVRIEKMMDSNAQELRSLEHVQAANIERLTAALVQNAAMIRDLGEGQRTLGDACEQLRSAMKESHERSSTMVERSLIDTVSVRRAERCRHLERKGPRKIRRKVVGYVYAGEPEECGQKTLIGTLEREE